METSKIKEIQMADEAVARAGLFFDELNKVRVLKPDTATSSGELLDESGDFVRKINGLQQVSTALLEAVDVLHKLVEKEKLKAIGSRNALKSSIKQKERDRRQLQILVRERQIELERLRLEQEALLHQEADQKEHQQQFLAPL